MTYRTLINQYQNRHHLLLEEIKTVIYYVNGLNYTSLILQYDDEVLNLPRIRYYLRKLIQGIPVSYAIRQFENKGTIYYLNRHVLIPRPETLELINIIQKEQRLQDKIIVDVGTGSGIIGIELAKETKTKVYLLDISSAALSVTKRNAKRILTITNYQIMKSDLLDALVKANCQVDLIVSNPPYISKEEILDKSVFDYEPHQALFAEPPLYFYQEILKQSLMVLKPNGSLYFEINPLFAETLKDMAQKYYPQAEITLMRDLYHKVRFLKLINVK
ncbi:MAG: peptide chain release factor N(5)-glutamine methyltransferase [Erysipelotrichaceae bacterium]|nr:peptide chain release factor N(5)-glutamine methyltransferase [Erysipelotrichaceae bacterium]